MLARAVAAALAAAAACLPAASAQSQTFNVLDYGAKGDGHSDDTAAVRAAMADAAAAGGGRAVFPAGYTFLTGAFNLSSNLAVDIAGTVLGE
jgi:polygalacturonase